MLVALKIPKPRRDRESGYALLLIFSLMTVLLSLGTLIMQSALLDIDLAYSERVNNTALQVAEAGVRFGMDRLMNPPYNYGVKDGTSKDLSSLTSPSNVSSAALKEICKDTRCKQERRWHYLQDFAFNGQEELRAVNYPEGAGNDTALGHFHVYVSCDSFPCDENTPLVLRVLGGVGSQARDTTEVCAARAKKIIEVLVEPPN